MIRPGRLAGIAVLGLAGCAPTGYPHANPAYAATDGQTAAIVEIDASPGPAWIFIDGELAGTTPLEYEMTYAAGARSVEVVAVPLHPAQVRQSKRLKVPPLPRHLHFFLDNPPATAARQ